MVLRSCLLSVMGTGRIGEGSKESWNSTTKVLRTWFSTAIKVLVVLDGLIDVFQGRAIRGVLEKHYIGKNLEFEVNLCESTFQTFVGKN